MTPDQVHFGQTDAVYAARQHTLDRACRQHPERFVNRAPKPPAKPTATWINPPPPKRLLPADAVGASAEAAPQQADPATDVSSELPER